MKISESWRRKWTSSDSLLVSINGSMPMFLSHAAGRLLPTSTETIFPRSCSSYRDLCSLVCSAGARCGHRDHPGNHLRSLVDDRSHESSPVAVSYGQSPRYWWYASFGWFVGIRDFKSCSYRPASFGIWGRLVSSFCYLPHSPCSNKQPGLAPLLDRIVGKDVYICM